jgi:RecA-family ATPase
MNTVDFTSQRNRRPLPLNTRNAGDFQGLAVPERNWLVPSILIRGGVTMLSGDGGMGKSLLCLQLQVAAALGAHWMGIEMPAGVSSFGFYCEDDEDELHRRLYDICRHYQCSFADLGDRVRFVSRVGESNELMTFFGRGDQGKRTVLLDQLEEEVKLWGHQLIILDTVADIFMGNENIRPQVRAFITAIRRLAIINAGGVILTAHPSRAGLADGSGLSGSTGWNGSVRSRIYFTKPKSADRDVDGEEEPTNDRVLKTMKSNYGPAGDKMRVKWQEGVFVRTDLASAGASMFDRIEVDRQILEAATYMVSRGSLLAADPNARSSLAVLARNLPTCKHIAWKDAIGAQERLIQQGRLEIVEMGPPSKRRVYVRPAHQRYPGEEGGGETEQSIPPKEPTP